MPDSSHQAHISPQTPRRFHLLTQVVPVRFNPPKVDRASLRIFFEKKAIYVLMVAALVLMFSPYILVGFLTEEEQLSVAHLARNPAALQMLILIVVCKMLGLGAIFTCLPLVKRWFFFAPDKPILVASDEVATRQRRPPLSLAQRMVLTHGSLTFGKVQRVDWPRVTVAYKGPHGERHTARLKAHETVAPLPREGESIALLYDPQAPAEVVAPRLLEVAFDDAPAADQRVSPESLTGAVDPAQGERRANAPLLSTLHPFQPPLLMSLRRRLIGQRQLPPLVGSLRVEGGELTLTHQQRPEPVRLSLERPFVASVSVWLLSNELAEVNLTLRPRGATPGHPSICLRTELPQCQLSRELTVKQEEHPYVSPEDFALLWPTLQFHAAVHGLDLTGLLTLERQPEAPRAEAAVEVGVGAVVG